MPSFMLRHAVRIGENGFLAELRVRFDGGAPLEQKSGLGCRVYKVFHGMKGGLVYNRLTGAELAPEAGSPEDS